MRIDLTSV